ncbi:hypothetical protein BS47DRAFT_1350826 [Hydnum rufescens UP504]|uniref:Cyclin-like domain-containing protein n=1 Tax=Hydnum rufescens UP504 TaxID=1448309 RepID=A0A9P6ALJ0_9AGAM|nr:hypothetical protein BS47DRAFT_1350826 [Hydnum rufescens UP504]
MTLACAPSHLSLPPISSLKAPGWSSQHTTHMQHHADSFWSAPGPSRTPRLSYANANELSSALESFTLSSTKKPSGTAPTKLSAMPTATYKRATPRSRSVNPYGDPQKQSLSPSSVETTFVSQNTGDMMCYLWFSTNLGAPRPSASSRTEQLVHESVPLAVKAELARLQFSPSAHFITFLGTLLSTTQVSQGVIVLSLYYIYRLKMLNPHIRGMEGSEFRLAVIALMLANKFLDDNTYTNKTWSEVSGITLTEINLMEREFLQGIDHRLYIDFGTFQHWGKLLSGLLLAKEQEAQSWRRRTARHVSKHSRLSPITPRTHPPQDASSSRPRTHRARSTSPLSSVRLAPAPYPFTFAPPPLAQVNPFSQAANTDGYAGVSPSRPAGSAGAKRSAVDAFTPTPMAPFKLVKREDLPVISTNNLAPQNGRTATGPWDNRGSPIIDSPMELTPVESDASDSPYQAIKVEKVEQPERPRQQTLQAPFPHNHERWQSIARPQYLTFNALASSPSGTPDRLENHAGAGARKSVLRYQEPPALASIHQYHPNYRQFAASSHRFDQIQTPLYSQSARTSPRDDTPSSNLAQDPYIFHNNLNDNHLPHSVYSSNIPRSTSTSFLQPRQALPVIATRVPSPPQQYDGRRLQFAPFANAGPPGVHHWSSGLSSLSNYAEAPMSQYNSNWRLNAASAVGSTELGSPVMRGRKM